VEHSSLKLMLAILNHMYSIQFWDSDTRVSSIMVSMYWGVY
jgi:hypothetical protein